MSEDEHSYRYHEIYLQGPPDRGHHLSDGDQPPMSDPTPSELSSHITALIFRLLLDAQLGNLPMRFDAEQSATLTKVLTYPEVQVIEIDYAELATLRARVAELATIRDNLAEWRERAEDSITELLVLAASNYLLVCSELCASRYGEPCDCDAAAIREVEAKARALLGEGGQG